MILVGVICFVVLVVWIWRRLRKAAKRRAAVVQSAPLVQAMGGSPVVRQAPSRWHGSRGQM